MAWIFSENLLKSETPSSECKIALAAENQRFLSYFFEFQKLFFFEFLLNQVMANVTLKRPATSVVVSKGLADLQSLQEGEPMSKNALQFMKDWVAKQSRAG